MNRIYRIPSVEGKEKLAEGYKILRWDWKGVGDYSYADPETGEVEGSIHTVEGELIPCNWGIHFCKNPLDCLIYKEPVPWMRFAKVSAYDEITRENDDKTVARTIRIDKVLTFDGFIRECKIYGGCDINGGCDIYGASEAMFCHDCEGVFRVIFCFGLKGARLQLFNRAISEKRFKNVWNGIEAAANGWYPNFTNAEELKEKYGSGEWKNTPAPAIRGRSHREVYADMPETLISYIKSLPEYDEEIFQKITGGKEI